MSLEMQRAEDGRYVVDYIVPADMIKGLLKDVYREIKKEVSIPGFRRGKVPYQMGVQLYGDLLYNRALNRVAIPCFYGFLRENPEIKMLGEPELSLEDKVVFGEDVKVKALFDIFPEVELGQYTALTVPTKSCEPTEEDIAAYLRQVQERNARLVTVTDRGAENGDLITFNYTATVDGQTFEGGQENNAFVELGTRKSEFEGLEDGLLGVKQGEHRVVTATLPELDKYPEDVRGKDAQFDCEILSVQYHEYPELDDEFAGDVSSFDTLEEYKADVAQKMKESNEGKLKELQNSVALKKLFENCKFEMPLHFLEIAVENQEERVRKTLEGSGLQLEEFLMGSQGKSIEQFRDDTRNAIASDLAMELVMTAIADKENIEVTEEEIQAFIEERIKAEGQQGEAARARYATESGKNEARILVRNQKALDLVLSTLIEEEMPQEPGQE